ncbi:MAG: hypothetical protein MJ233_00325 [Mycoplasmoidaceae bacterium]|nr:hypothetical protein [Mycoplasmoidaceae bacterium]
MKKNYLLSTVLSISALSVLPLASCAVEGTHSLLSTLKNTNETVNIKVSATVGTGHTFEGSPTAEKGKDYRCRFVSTRYEIEDELFVPVHKSLKPKDLEIICDGENIISSCTLQNNVLTIPANKLTDDITINILGAEIAE